RHPLVVWIDDLQWGDRDSSTFLAHLCDPPQQPPLLLLLTFRSEELASNSTLAYLHQMLATQLLTGMCRQIALSELSVDESRGLLRSLLRDSAPRTVVETIISEAGGHPLFLQQ